MKTRNLFPLAVLANLSKLSLCGMSRFDLPIGPVLFLPVLHAMLFLLNLKAGQRWWQIILLGIEHIAVTIGFIALDSRLYAEYVYADWDPAHILFSVFALYIGIGITVILLIVSLLMFNARQRKLKQTS